MLAWLPAGGGGLCVTPKRLREPVLGSGAVFYADPVAGSDSNPGTLAAPFRTIVKGVAACRAADAAPCTLHLRAGTFYLTDTVLLGTEDAGLTIAGVLVGTLTCWFWQRGVTVSTRSCTLLGGCQHCVRACACVPACACAACMLCLLGPAPRQRTTAKRCG